jgi:hypothetical protein
MPLQKAADFKDCSYDMVVGGLLQDAAQMKLDVLSAMHIIAESWRLITHTTIKNYFVRCAFLIDHVSSNDDSTMKLTEDEKDDWHTLQPLGVQSADYPTYDSVLRSVQSIFLCPRDFTS